MAEEANINEAITAEYNTSNKMGIDLIKDEQKTKAYEDKMKIDIENINTIKNRNKVYTTQWRKIYEVIKPYILKKTDIFQIIL